MVYPPQVTIHVFSDIHSDLEALRRLMDREADYYLAAGDLVNWAKGLPAVGETLQRRAGRVGVIPGNHESAAQIETFCLDYGFENLHGQTKPLGSYTLAALGYSNPTPFRTPGEYSEAELTDRLGVFRGLRPMILVCHCPPAETALDRSGPGRHFGSTAVREFLDSEQPDYFFCGHIHEAAGIQVRLGRTFAMNVGKLGYLLEVPGGSLSS
jgi:Icc-related predicted phosphoesterase